MNKEEILKKYKLTDEEHEQYYQTIKRIYTGGKIPVNNPIAVIIGGQTGAGKSGIIGYSTKMFTDENVIIINSDEIKPFHPKSEEIAKLYPDMYTIITDQESNTWTSKLFEELRREKYNIIFEGTMKNNRIADESITELQKLGYTIVVRGIATCDLESRMSILERYEGQVSTKGWGRLVTPDQPINVYASHNDLEKEKIKRALENKKAISKYTRKFGYKDAKSAVLGARDEEYDRVIATLPPRIKGILESMEKRNASNEEKAIVLELMNECKAKLQKKKDNIKENIDKGESR